MKHNLLRKLILSAIFSALTFCLTFIIQIPIPVTGGYINLGDGIVLISGFILGPLYGGFASAIGSSLADLVSGYAIYAFPTAIIKFSMAFVAGLLFKHLKKNTLSVILCSGIAELIMIAGYFIFEAYVLGLGWAVALPSVTSNIFQAIAAICASALLIQIFIDQNGVPRKGLSLNLNKNSNQK